MRTIYAILPALLVLHALPAAAGYYRVDWSGTFAFGPWTGTPIDYDVVFDTDSLIDRTATANAAIVTLGLGAKIPLGSISEASLSDDPSASLLITIPAAGISFSKFNAVGYGTPFGDTKI